MRWGCSTDMSPYDVLRRNLAINKLKGDNYGCSSQGLLGLFAIHLVCVWNSDMLLDALLHKECSCCRILLLQYYFTIIFIFSWALALVDYFYAYLNKAKLKIRLGYDLFKLYQISLEAVCFYQVAIFQLM